MKKSLVSFLLVCILLMAFSGVALAAKITLVNKTGVEIHGMYFSSAKTKNWEEDMLNGSVLKNGETVIIEFSKSDGGNKWDLMVKDDDDEELIWYDLNLKGVKKITLDKKGYANLE